MAKLKTLAPILQVEDVRRTAQFYGGTLGFKLNFAVTGERETVHTLEERADAKLVYAQMAQNGVEMMFQAIDALDAEDGFLQGGQPGNGAVSFYFLVEDADALCAEARERGAEIVAGPRTAWYGMREFFMRDPDGYILGFAHAAEPESG